MKKVMLMMLTVLSLQETRVNAGYYATAAMDALKVASPWIPGVAKTLMGAAVCAYADHRATQLVTHADSRIASLNDGIKGAVVQTNQRIDSGIKTAQDAVLVGAGVVDGVNNKMNQAAGLAQIILAAMIQNPSVQRMFEKQITPEMCKAFGLETPAPLKWYEKLWKGACDLTVKTVSDTSMHIFSQMISKFMINSVNRLVLSPEQEQLQTVPARGAHQANEESGQAQQPARYRAAIRRRR